MENENAEEAARDVVATSDSEEEVPRRRAYRARRSPGNFALPPQSQRQAALHRWTTNNAPVISGSKGKRRLRFSTLRRAYTSYFNDEEVHELRPLSYPTFTALLYQWAIPPSPYDPYACPHCYNLHNKDPGRLSDAEKIHSKSLDQVWTEYKSHIGQLSSGSADFILILIDYSRVHEVESVQLTQGGKRGTLSILNWTLVFPGNNEEHYDFFSNSSQGEAFLFNSMEFMVPILKDKLVNVKKIMVWSDGGFKNYGTVSNWKWLYDQLQVPIYYRFFVAYHGHNRCDAHFGRGKIALRKQYPDGAPITHDRAMLAFEALPNTFTRLLMRVPDAGPGRWTYKYSSAGVKSWAGIRFDNHGIANQVIGKGYPNDFEQIVGPSFEDDFLSTPSLKVNKQRPIDHAYEGYGIHSPPSFAKPYSAPRVAYPPIPSRTNSTTSTSKSFAYPPPTAAHDNLIIRIPTELYKTHAFRTTTPRTLDENRKRKIRKRS